MNRTRPGDFHLFECYLDQTRKNFIAINLITFAYRYLKTSSIIQKIGEIDIYYNSEEKTQEGFAERFADILFDSSIDNIRISICFENYFKAKLLLNGFLIHKIDKSKHPKLYDLQKKKPIDEKEIIKDSKFPESFNKLKESLKDNTIDYSTLLTNKDYYKYFNISENTIEFLNRIRLGRNELHLLISEKFSINKAYINSYKAIENIANTDITILQNTLLDGLDPESKSRILFKPSYC